MEITLLKVLVEGLSLVLHLPFSGNVKSELVLKRYKNAEEILELLKPVIDAIANSDIASDEVLWSIFEELHQAVEELTELFESWQLLSSKVCIVMQVESLISKIQTLGLNVFEQLKVSHQCLPDELSSEISLVIKDAIREQVKGEEPSSKVLAKISENLGLRSNQEVLIEAVALEKLKENAEQIEDTAEAEYIDQIIALVTRMHERLVTLKEAQRSSPILVPTDFCCPLSLELMTDPVIVASGQTYERSFIKSWIDLGLTVCPKTRQTLSHTNLIPNYTVKALIANWCELNNVKPVDPIKSSNLNQESSLHGFMDSGPTQTDKNLPCSEIHQEGSSPLHPRSISEGSLSGMIHGQCLDISRISPSGSDDLSASSDERSEDLVSQHSMSPSRKESSNAFSSEQSQTHARIASDSSAPSNNSGDSRDASGEVNPRPDNAGATTMNASQREPEFSPQLVGARPRSQGLLQRPLERFNPRMTSTTTTSVETSGIETRVRNLVEDLKSSSLDTQREATAELRLLAKHNMDNRIVIGNCGVISLLVDLVQSTDARIQENAVTALLNLSINDNNKAAIANAGAIDNLIHVLETGSPEAKENSAATLYSLSVMEENKIKIGRSGAIGPLVDLLANGTPRGKKDAATALFNLSIFHENKGRIVDAGAVKHLVELMDPAAGMVDKAVAVLANLATIQEGRVSIGQEGGIPLLVEVVELGSARGKENAAAALLHLCSTSPKFLNMVLQEGAVPPLVALSQSGTPRAREKAQALLNQFRSQRHGNAGRG
ncbi:U-box domain-containing protein 4 [Senna tora]|uniref:RING-type E3 ubiquitin transferase n=1 Tax=Senna tora TaxID=362788 RepID=A0A834WWJ9_9FABA|nr:U-box domain-containing protein 4 [Senna tora]